MTKGSHDGCDVIPRTSPEVMAATCLPKIWELYTMVSFKKQSRLNDNFSIL